MTEHRKMLEAYFTHPDLAVGSSVIAWGEEHLQALEQSADPAVRHFAQGLQAWLEEDFSMAVIYWRLCQQAGLNGYVLETLIANAPTTLNNIVSIYTDGSFSQTKQVGGAACVYVTPDHIGLLARHLPAPVSDNNYTEAYALYLALTAPELAEQSLAIYTDSITIVNALEEPTRFRLPPATTQLLQKVSQLCLARNVPVRHLRSRTGHLLQARADNLARWICTLGEWPQTPLQGAEHA